MTVEVIPVINHERYLVNAFKEEPPLNWLRERVGGYIEIIYLGDRQMIANHDGYIEGLPVNIVATQLYRKMMRNNKYPEYFIEKTFIVGSVVLLDGVHLCK